MSALVTEPVADTWVPIPDESDFGLDNLAFGVVRDRHATHLGPSRVVVRIGDHVLDLAAAAVLPDLTTASDLGPLLASGRISEARRRARDVLVGRPRHGLLTSLDEVVAVRPFVVGDYVDFYSSIEHATNVGRILRPGADPLPAHWRHLPMGYHGRAGTVVVSGTPIARPCGLVRGHDHRAQPTPTYGPSRALDFELEVGFVVGGAPAREISPDDALAHVAGAVLINDWSARDLQAFEYQPLGPFLGKSFATTMSPWVVTMDALLPHLVDPPAQDPLPAPHLRAARPWAIDLRLRAELEGEVVTEVDFAPTYWTFAQQLAHLTSNGATTAAGDLFASGTVSGPLAHERGSLIERTWGGTQPFPLRDGRTRNYLEDGDTVRLTGWCGGAGRPRVGFGEAVGTIVPARSAPGSQRPPGLDGSQRPAGSAAGDKRIEA